MQQNNKNILRGKALKILKAIPFKTKTEKSKLIEKKILNLALYKKSDVVMLFVGKNDEVQTLSLLKKIIKEKGYVILPKVNLKSKKISLHKSTNVNNLIVGAYNILEPPKNYFKKKNVELIFVPGLLFTTNGNRLGRGRGYYDKLLKEFTICKIGLCFEKQIVKKLPLNKNDVKLNYLLTERRIINCQKKNKLN